MFENRDMTKESGEYLASPWILICLWMVLCIYTDTHVAYFRVRGTRQRMEFVTPTELQLWQRANISLYKVTITSESRNVTKESR